MIRGDEASTPMEAGGSVDALRSEFESVDAFFQALLGLRAVCVTFDESVDHLAGLAAGTTAEWARSGEMPATDDARSDRVDEDRRSGETPIGDDGLAVLLGAIAMRRSVELGFRDLVDAVPAAGDGEGQAESSDERAQTGHAGSLLR